MLASLTHSSCVAVCSCVIFCGLRLRYTCHVRATAPQCSVLAQARPHNVAHSSSSCTVTSAKVQVTLMWKAGADLCNSYIALSLGTYTTMTHNWVLLLSSHAKSALKVKIPKYHQLSARNWLVSSLWYLD